MRDTAPVLVVTRLDDATADLVIGELHRRGVPVMRLDPGDFPDEVTLTVAFDASGPHGRIGTRTRTLDPATVRSVYWRRPRPYASGTGRTARWCADQARHGLGGILAALPGAHYVNHPWRNHDAEHKPAQLAVATRCGLRVPPTLITNEPEQARRFVAEQGPVVYKPLWNGDFADDDGRAMTVWIEDVPEDSADAGVSRTAHLFQKRLDKAADVRLTAVADRLFPVRIDGSPGIDWRRHYDSLTYRVVAAPPDVVRGVRAYLDRFGLVFGAFDFGIGLDGRWWMYECNPNGQWAWFPDDISRPVAVALADRLQQGG
ncbi:ATP-grasp ribosomal peptide maturase [Streptomyces sp. PTM05]|uniref:ATP-grasp ribosomal peptide maturase n=1 Tax=Streptantibioticus parmotrematis TaxID=2873249 RepID=A0ABS7R0Y4_9ACTN|nr:ATP-grasp ribosomal peptide maturase [Streptantibioticus parmotrematis]MBY8887672.1 ATP-grasp ribosomal peptide maturase [Streptantibioticus parmotrematis]